jgi:hypothetical protein
MISIGGGEGDFRESVFMWHRILGIQLDIAGEVFRRESGDGKTALIFFADLIDGVPERSAMVASECVLPPAPPHGMTVKGSHSSTPISNREYSSKFESENSKLGCWLASKPGVRRGQHRCPNAGDRLPSLSG